MMVDHQDAHRHADGHDHRSASRRRLVLALSLISGYMGVEIVAGILSGSLALLADAAHMLTAAAAIGLALFAMWIANRPASIERTFGYHRTEVLAAMFNAFSLWVIAAWIFLRGIPPLSGRSGGAGRHRAARRRGGSRREPGRRLDTPAVRRPQPEC